MSPRVLDVRVLDVEEHRRRAARDRGPAAARVRFFRLPASGLARVWPRGTCCAE
ncbi:hypothetical protein [Sorangium sp. So ce341]|uniref:hypothetical protein n=1 Tax=Sorangium sp. So ce341 TaxID=3133302 RepID=UPI003F5DFCB6